MNTRLLAPLLALLLVSAATLLAFPRLAAEHAEPCRNCHFSPSGAGARTEYGNSTTAFNELTLPQTKKFVKDLYRKPRIGDALIVGFDTRYLMLKSGRTFRMQTDGYLTVEPFKGFYYHFRFGNTGVKENYAMLTLDDNKYSLRLGTFYPAFGLHNDDHNAYNRVRTGNGPEVYLDGASLAADLFGGQAMVEVFNPDERYMVNLHGFRATTLGPFGLLAGASLRLVHDSSLFPTAKSLFGALNWNRFTGTGELDIVGKGNDTVIVYGGLTTRLEYGLYLVGEYNFFDPNRHYQTGTDKFTRFSIEFYPVPFVLLRPSYTHYNDHDTHNPDDEFFVQFHVGY